VARTLTDNQIIFTAGVSLGFHSAIQSLEERNRQTASNTPTVTQNKHRLASLSGLFADDPMWPEYLEALKKIREDDDLVNATSEA
jgi:hypothetical protein